MIRSLLFAALLSCLCACTVVKINHGDTTTIEHKAGADVANDLTTQACRRARGGTPVIVSTVNKDASLPVGTGRQVTTFRCASDAQ